ncbi:MAG: kynureninase [Planctomycetia bacterium]|nr:kynureninase [Planctomycetia bacterium]
MRERFHLPARVYLCGHSLGPLAHEVTDAIIAELDTWRTLGVTGHFAGPRPWMRIQEGIREPLARLAGARPDEVVAMNALTVNLHLMLATFFRGHGKIVIDEPTFPSDRYAVTSHLVQRGLDPSEYLLTVSSLDELEQLLSKGGVELTLLAGVNWLTGEVLAIKHASDLCRRYGVVLGLDLAHAVGNVPLSLHEDGVDFAVWCSYKYLNAGPGAVAGCFVHQRHGNDLRLSRWAGWWGNDPATRFRMHLERDFVPVAGAEGWQLSNPPILALAPLRASLGMFDEVGMDSLRKQSIQLFEQLLSLLPSTVRLSSPRECQRRGNMVCLQISNPERAQARFAAAGIVCDVRPPDTIRASFCPLYNTPEDVEAFAKVLCEE